MEHQIKDRYSDLILQEVMWRIHIANDHLQSLCAHLRTLPTDSQCYGLVHFDAHGGNILVDESGHLMLFDFDECTNSWYANDIAIALFAMVIDAPNVPVFTQEFMIHFLRGYRMAYHLDRNWLREIPFPIPMILDEISYCCPTKS